MSPSEPEKASISIVQDLAKLLITLATGLVAFSATLSNKTPSSASSWILLLSWISLGISVLGGIFALSSLVNKLSKDDYRPFEPNIRIPSIIQYCSFFLGILLFLVFAFMNMDSNKQSKDVEPHRHFSTHAFRHNSHLP